MSISSTGLYGSATIVNSDLFNDVEDLKEQVTTLSTSYLDTTREHREDISQNRLDISLNRQDISQNRLDISLNRQDISQNRLDISLNRFDISKNRQDISQNKADISLNRFDISQNKADISLNRFDISQNKADISKNRFDISQNKADISLNRFDISQNKSDISKNRFDISQNKSDISKNRVDISQNKADISLNRFDISQNKSDISKNRVDISKNKADISQNTFDISQNKADISENTLDIIDISSNKAFIRSLQSVDYSITLANAPAQWPTPVIQSGYNGVFCTDAGIDIIAQNFLPLKIGLPSVLSFRSTDTSDNAINIISKGLNFINTIDNSNQLIIDNEGVFIKDRTRNEDIDTRGTGFQNLNDWMKSVEDALITLGGFGGTGFTWLDLVLGGVGILASMGAFAAAKSAIVSLGVAMKSAFLGTTILNSIDDGVDLAKEFKDDFIEDAFANSSNAVIRSNAEEAFKNVSHDELIAFMFKNYARTHEVFNHKFYELNGVKTYFQSVGGLVDATKVVPQNLFRTMFENRCGFKNNIYVPNIFFGAAFAANAVNHDYFPGAYSLNDLKLNVDTINTNVANINTNLSSLQLYINAPPATFNIYIADSDMYGNIYLYGSDRLGSFGYGTSKRLININDGDTVNIFLSETVVAFTNLPGVTDIAVLITFNGVTTWEAYAGDQRRSTISYTLKSTDSLQIKTGWWGPGINYPPMSGMLDPVNFTIKETINSVYYTKTQIDGKGYLTAIPAEYITDSELTAKGYLTVIPAEYITETELNAKGYLTAIPAEYITDSELTAKGYLTTIPAEYITDSELTAKGYLTAIPAEYITDSELTANHYTKAQSDTNYYTKSQVQALAGTNMTWNNGTSKFDVSIPPSPLPYTDTNVRTVLSNSAGTNMTWNNTSNTFNVGIGIATTSALGTVQIGSGLSITPQGLLTANASAVGIATTAALGTVRIGSGLSITPQGLLTANASTYTLPQATTANLGGVKVDGSTIVINNSTGVIGSVHTEIDWNNNDSSSRAYIANKPTFTSSQWTTSGSNIYFNGGNVGIGTVTNTTGVKFDVRGIIESNAGIGAGNSFYFKGVANSDLCRVISNGDHATGTIANDTVLRSTRKLFLQSGIGAPGIVIDTSNNVGIGTTTPTNKLQINHSSTSENADVGSISLYVYNPTNAANQKSIITNRIAGTASDKVIYSWDVNLSHGWSMYTSGNNTALRINSTWGGTSGYDRITIAYNGAVGIQNSGYVIPNNLMAAGSLTIGNSNANYGNGNSSNSNMAGLMLECLNNTEIAVHDAGNAFHSFMRYTEVGNFMIGRDMGWGAASLTVNGNLQANSWILSALGQIYARNGFDVVLHADGGQMSINFGNVGSGATPSYLKLGAYGGHTFMESNSSRNIYLRVWHGTFNGTLRQWEFNANAGAYNSINSSMWSQYSDHRIKENIVKANLKTCYDNVKNINLYRFNYIDSFQTGSADKNKLGYIAQEVKRHFPKATNRKKERLTDKREVPDLLTIDVEQINLTLYGAVKQLIKIVEKQDKRIKTLESLLNIEDNNDVQDDAGEAYERIYDEEECNIDDIEPTEPPQDKAPENTVITE